MIKSGESGIAGLSRWWTVVVMAMRVDSNVEVASSEESSVLQYTQSQVMGR